MAQYFLSPDDLKSFVKSKGSSDNAWQAIIDMLPGEQSTGDEQDIKDACESIFTEDSGNDASEILFGVLAKHNITRLNKKAEKMNKEAASRQRNGWERGMRNKWNRVVDAHNENTPWRVQRDKYYDFTHYHTDEIKLDEDPNHIYSGEALWRTYVMDKFYRDYKDENGRVVGGYINDRFYVFPTAGTPANPDAPRTGGNQMELADGERTRKPRPHQYSTERRLEEARGNDTKDIVLAQSKFNKIVKVASSHLEEAQDDRIYQIFRDTIEMREAGLPYETILESVADHYDASILGVAQIDKVAQKLVQKHAGIGYETMMRKAVSLVESLNMGQKNTFEVADNNVQAISPNGVISVDPGTRFVQVADNAFQITNSPVNPELVGQSVQFSDLNFQVNNLGDIQMAADDLGLNEEIPQEQAKQQDFSITDVTENIE